jgi:hypothetical protein
MMLAAKQIAMIPVASMTKTLANPRHQRRALEIEYFPISLMSNSPFFGVALRIALVTIDMDLSRSRQYLYR